MHEVSLVHALFDQIARAIGRHPPTAVGLVRVRIGARAGVEPALFESAFDAVHDELGFPLARLELVNDPGATLVLERLELDLPEAPAALPPTPESSRV